MRHLPLVLLALVCLAAAGASAQPRTVGLDELDLSPIRQGWGEPQAKQSVAKKPLTLEGRTHERGVGLHAPGTFFVELDGSASRFSALAGVDGGVGDRGTVTLTVFADGAKVFESGVMRGGAAPMKIDLPLSGVRSLTFSMGDAGDKNTFDHLDLAHAFFETGGGAPKVVNRPPEEAYLLTPPPPAEPRINGPRVFGVTPGAPFIYRIPTTGERPMRFAADGLPEGLALDPEAGIITGTVTSEEKRPWDMTLRAENAKGKVERPFRLVVGDTLALTPPMGWNHWYAHYDRITDAMMREAADIMVATGMADAGYMYVNIDDCWMNAPKQKDPLRVGPARDENGTLLANAHFPDMRGLTDYIHAKGLRAGTYISPGPLTCAGFTGSYQHEEQDAKTFSDWGFDFLKYDWCSYGDIARKEKGDEAEKLKKPYRQMSALLREQERDIVFNLCQYGMGDVWTWGEEVGGHCWRTAGDLGFELNVYHAVARRNAEHHAHARPGAWNDPDYLQIGWVGDARVGGEPTPCPLTPSEQYSYMSLWCLMAAPLFYSGDMTQLDAFTLNVLCNPEVIEINQDTLGKQGYPVHVDGEREVWTKPLEDGSLAVGLFNTGEASQDMAFSWAEAGLSGKYRLRDLWRQKDLGTFEGSFAAGTLPRHGVMLLRAWPEK